MDMLVPLGQLKETVSVSHPAFWYVRNVPDRSAAGMGKAFSARDYITSKRMHAHASAEFRLVIVVLCRVVVVTVSSSNLHMCGCAHI